MENLKKQRLNIPEGGDGGDCVGFKEEKDDIIISEVEEIKVASSSSSSSSSSCFVSPSPPAVSDHNHNNPLTLSCSSCQQQNNKFHPKLFEIYHENICYDCYENSPETYRQITQQELKDQYFLTTYQIQNYFPYYEMKANPLQKSFHCMKLFLFKHVKEFLEKKYGTMAKFELMKRERDEKKVRRELEKYENRLKTVGIEAAEGGEGGEGEGGRKGRGKGESMKSQKKRKADLMIKSLVSIIKGEDSSS
jgi:hypothetical protein